MTADAEYVIPEGHAQEHPPGVATGGPNAESPRTYQEPARKKAAEQIAVGCTQGRIPL